MTTMTLEAVMESASLDTQPDDAAEQQDSVDKILSLLAELSSNQQEVLRLKFQHGLSYREISSVTGLTETNVGFLMHVGIKRLRELMK